MAPVATTPQPTTDALPKKPANGTAKPVNPFYSPTVGDEDHADDDYEFSRYKVNPPQSSLLRSHSVRSVKANFP